MMTKREKKFLSWKCRKSKNTSDIMCGIETEMNSMYLLLVMNISILYHN